MAGLISRLLGDLPEPDITPGPWWRSYARDYSRHFRIPLNEVIKHTAIVEGTNGYVWATETEEWDLKWFNKRGYAFPSRWVHYHILDSYQGVPGTPVRLDV